MKHSRGNWLCRCCGAGFVKGRAGQWDYAGGQNALCLRCWREWVASEEYREGAAQPVPDAASLERWLTARAGAFSSLARPEPTL